MSLSLDERTVKALEAIASASKKNVETLTEIKKLLDEITTSVAQISAAIDNTNGSAE